MAYGIKSTKKLKEKKEFENEYYEIDITKTSKPIGSKEKYSALDIEKKYFKSKEEVDKFLKENYGKVRKTPMFQDTKEGESQKVGYVYGFKNRDWSHNSESWFQQDWVTIHKIKSSPIL